jgi:hypothetical protein
MLGLDPGPDVGGLNSSKMQQGAGVPTLGAAVRGKPLPATSISKEKPRAGAAGSFKADMAGEAMSAPLV